LFFWCFFCAIMAKFAVALGCVGALAMEPRHAKGFVRQPRNGLIEVAVLTADMRKGAPDALDWSTSGGTSPVKDQGYCGSCWAFSATEAVESALYQQHGVNAVLATQQLVACDTTDGGCQGGDLPTAFDYFMSSSGVDTAEDYPDTSSQCWRQWMMFAPNTCGACMASDHSPAAKVTGYKFAVPMCEGGSCNKQDESGLMAALHQFGPLSVIVNAQTWNDYTTGIYDADCSGAWNQLDHAVQLVGYDSTGSSPYWKVKNSWGVEAWGEGGFIRLPMGVNACGIADEAMYVTAEMISADVSV